MSKGKMQTPLDLAREKTGRLATMLTEVVDGVRVLGEQKKALTAQVAALIASAAPDALTHADRLTEQGESLGVDLARKAAMREGIEENIRASASALAALEKERDREILDAQGRELNEVRRLVFEKLWAFVVEFARDVGAMEPVHHEHQTLRQKVYGSPEGRAKRELATLQGVAARLTQDMRGMP